MVVSKPQNDNQNDDLQDLDLNLQIDFTQIDLDDLDDGTSNVSSKLDGIDNINNSKQEDTFSADNLNFNVDDIEEVNEEKTEILSNIDIESTNNLLGDINSNTLETNLDLNSSDDNDNNLIETENVLQSLDSLENTEEVTNEVISIDSNIIDETTEVTTDAVSTDNIIDDIGQASDEISSINSNIIDETTEDTTDAVSTDDIIDNVEHASDEISSIDSNIIDEATENTTDAVSTDNIINDIEQASNEISSIDSNIIDEVTEDTTDAVSTDNVINDIEQPAIINQIDIDDELTTPDVTSLIEQEETTQEVNESEDSGINLDEIQEETTQPSLNLDEIVNNPTSTGININGIVEEKEAINIDSLIETSPIILETEKTSKIQTFEEEIQSVKKSVNIDDITKNEKENVKKELTKINTKTIKKDKQGKALMKWIMISIVSILVIVGGYIVFTISNPLSTQTADINQGTTDNTSTNNENNQNENGTGSSVEVENKDDTKTTGTESKTTSTSSIRKEVLNGIASIKSSYTSLTTMEKNVATIKLSNGALDKIYKDIEQINIIMNIDTISHENSKTNKQILTNLKSNLKQINTKLVSYNNQLKDNSKIDLTDKNATEIKNKLKDILKIIKLQLEVK